MAQATQLLARDPHPATKAGEGFPHALSGGGSTPMRALARSILAIGLDALPRADHECFELADWRRAATDAIEGDNSDLAWMLLRDRAYNEFEEWRAADFARREDVDFDTWLDSRARWDRPNWYEGAVVRRAVA